MALRRKGTASESEVPRVPWDEHARYLDANLKPGQHVSVLTPTGGGKTYLICHGHLPLWRDGKVLLVDGKDDPDDTLYRFGKRIQRFPRRTDVWKLKHDEPQHWRLVLPREHTEARKVAHEALEGAYREGSWVVVLDETRKITDPRPPGLNLSPTVQDLHQRGRSRHLSVYAATQAPRWVPGTVYDQPSHIYIGRTVDRRTRLRLEEIGGGLDVEAIRPTLANLGKHEFLYVGEGGERLEVVRCGR